MDIVVASSRGFDVESLLYKNHPNRERLFVYSKSGGQTLKLAAKVPKIIKFYGDQGSQKHHVYFLSGLCDLTYMDRDWEYSAYDIYEEVFFTEPWYEAANRVTRDIYSAIESVRTPNITPVFCTVPPMSFRLWNEHRLKKGETSFLLHHSQYEEMQYSLISAIRSLNNNIVQINSANGMTTPHLATTVMQNMGPDRRPRVFYSRFRDGVHPGKDLKAKWAKKLIKAMTLNRDNSASATHPTDSDDEERDYVEALVSGHLQNAIDVAHSGGPIL